jgi:hypothetical protein
MWSTLVLNMHASYLLLNCGSNWHELIHRLRSSCGASPATVFCLTNQHPQAPFFVCDQNTPEWSEGISKKKREFCANRTQTTLDSLRQVPQAKVDGGAGHGLGAGAAHQFNLVDECAFVAEHRRAGAPPVVAFLVGLEGAGHHLVETVIRHIVPKVKNLFYSDEVNYWKDFGEPAGTSFLRHLDQHPDTHFFGQFSYPAGKKGRHDVTARVSLVKLVCLNATGAIDLRLVYIRRDPVDAVCSAVRRFLTNDDSLGVERTADIALEEFFYINRVLSHAEVAYEVIDFAEANTDKATMQGPLESFLRGLATPEAIKTAIEQTPVQIPRHGNDRTPLLPMARV